MKIYLAFRFTGEDPIKLEEKLKVVTSAIKEGGSDVYCSIEDENYFHENNFQNKDILQHELKKLDESDLLMALIDSSERSEGMLVEIGYILAKNKPFVLLIKRGIKTTTIHQMAKTVIEFDTLEELSEKLKSINFN